MWSERCDECYYNRRIGTVGAGQGAQVEDSEKARRDSRRHVRGMWDRVPILFKPGESIGALRRKPRSLLRHQPGRQSRFLQDLVSLYSACYSVCVPAPQLSTRNIGARLEGSMTQFKLTSTSRLSAPARPIYRNHERHSATAPPFEPLQSAYPSAPNIWLTPSP